MKRVVDQSDHLKLREFPWFYWLFFLVMVWVLGFSLWKLYLAGIEDLFQFIIVSICFTGACIGAIIYARYTTIEFLPDTGEMRWQRIGYRGRETGLIEFHAIESVVVETQRKNNLQLGRVVVHTAKCSLPFTPSYSGDFDGVTALAERVQQIIGISSSHANKDLIKDSVRDLVIHNRIIDATRLLITKTGVSITDARQQVRELQESICQDDGSGSGR